MHTAELFANLRYHFIHHFRYDDNIIDLADNPYISISFISSEQCERFDFYATPAHEGHSSKYNTLSNHILCNLLETMHINQPESSLPAPVTTDYGFCNSFLLGNVNILISVVADPEDAKFLFKYIQNQLEIILQQDETN